MVTVTAQRAERPATVAAGQINIIATPHRLYAKGGSDWLKPDRQTRIKLSSLWLLPLGITEETSVFQPSQCLLWSHVTYEGRCVCVCFTLSCLCVHVQLLCEVSSKAKPAEIFVTCYSQRRARKHANGASKTIHSGEAKQVWKADEELGSASGLSRFKWKRPTRRKLMSCAKLLTRAFKRSFTNALLPQ